MKGIDFMNDSTFNVNMEEGLKTQFELLCSKFGVTASYVINMFAKTAVKNKKIPLEFIKPNLEITSEKALRAFHALRMEARENGLQGMTLAEINQEIESARKEMK